MRFYDSKVEDKINSVLFGIIKYIRMSVVLTLLAVVFAGCHGARLFLVTT